MEMNLIHMRVAYVSHKSVCNVVIYLLLSFNGLTMLLRQQEGYPAHRSPAQVEQFPQ